MVKQEPKKFQTARKPQPREQRLAQKKQDVFVKPPPVADNPQGKLIMPVTEEFKTSGSQVSKPLGGFKAQTQSVVQMPTEGFVVNSTVQPKPEPAKVEPSREVASPSASNFSGGSPGLPPEQATEQVPMESCHKCGRTFNEKALQIHLKRYNFDDNL